MNLTDLQRKLLAAARANPPTDTVPYAFEKRILARLAEAPVLDTWALWNRVLWRAAAPCVALCLTLSVWSYFAGSDATSPEVLAADLESAVLAPFDDLGDSW
jgi:hypothetical protein